jgi:hypothetical protein
LGKKNTCQEWGIKKTIARFGYLVFSV